MELMLVVIWGLFALWAMSLKSGDRHGNRTDQSAADYWAELDSRGVRK